MYNNCSHMSKKVEERMNMWDRDVKDIKPN